MSAVRTNSNRAASRKKNSSPYARVFSSISRILGFSSSQDDQHEAENTLKDETNTQDGPTAEFLPTLSSKRSLNTNTAPPSSLSNSRKQPNPPSTADLVSDLSAIAGVAITNEIAGEIMNRLAQHHLPSNPSAESIPEPTFRFTSRQNSPIPSSTSSPNASPSSTPRKLPRNPNGSYRWEGGGSAKRRPHNRHKSPVIVLPSTPTKTSTSSEEDPLPDSKRRRLGEDGSSSSHPGYSESSDSSRPILFPASASPTTPDSKGVVRPNALSSSSRLRSPVKPTAPVVSSPLRQQVWLEGSPPSSRNDTRKSPSQQPKQTKAANLLADLIKETTTPAQKSNNFNPYEAASPVPKEAQGRIKRLRATGQPSVPTRTQRAEQQRKEEEEKQKKMDKLKEYSQQAIIEATVPKGSKRSRPPTHFERPPAVDDSPLIQLETPVVVEARKVSYTVEEVDDGEETQRSSKRSKSSVNGHGSPSSVTTKSPSPSPSPEITVEEVADVPMRGIDKEEEKAASNDASKLAMPASGNGSAPPVHTSSATSSRSSFGGLKPNSIPKEPSKLRFSFQAESASTPPSPLPPVSSTLPHSTPTSLPKTDFKFSPPSSGFNFSFKVDNDAGPSPTASSEQEVKKDDKPSSVDSIKIQVREMDVASLPKYDLTSTITSALPNITNHARVRDDVKVLPNSALPVFDFEATEGFSFNYDSSNPKRVYDPPKFKANGRSPPKIPKPFPPGTSAFTFEPSSFGSTSAPPVKGFDFAAAGMKVPTPKNDTWTCSDCMVTNPLSASKCAACEAPAPQGDSAPAAPPFTPPAVASKSPAVPVKGFDFAAAGMKMPSVNKDQWVCSVCAISNEKSLSKCQACETPITLFS